MPVEGIRCWILRTLQSCISLVETVSLGATVLDRPHILALENQCARLAWLVHELRHRSGLPTLNRIRAEYELRLDGELSDDEDLLYSTVTANPSEDCPERHFNVTR